MASPDSDVKQLIQHAIDDQMLVIQDEISNLRDSINNDLKLHYLNSVSRLLEKEAVTLIDSFKCPYEAENTSCKNWVKKNVRNYALELEHGDIPKAFEILNQLLKEIEDGVVAEGTRNPCRAHWTRLKETLDRHYELARDLKPLVERKMVRGMRDIDFDVEAIHEEFIVPLAHVLRMQILHALLNTSRRFTELKDMLGVKNTGLLVHHLKPLSEAGLITQNFKKDYFLTDRGYIYAQFLSEISMNLHSTKDLVAPLNPIVSSQLELNVIED